MANVDVYSQGGALGRLSNHSGEHVFSYRHDAAEAVSLTMPLRDRSYQYHGLHPVFQMNLPEGVLREVIERATAKRFGSSDLTMLAVLGSNQIGRLNYTLEGHELPVSDGRSPNLQELLNSEDTNLFTQLLERFALQSGVAGVQPKVLMDLKSAPASLSRKATLPLQSYIVKSWGPEYPELACNEFACLTFARNAGLNVAEFYLSSNGQLLITKRFDVLQASEAGPSQFLGFEDFCVLQGLGTREKYDASIEACANTIGHFISSGYRKQALYDFFKLTLVNVLLKNGDAHLKNIGVLYSNLDGFRVGGLPQSECHLAPVFDIVSTVPYIPEDTMALSLTGSKRWPKWKVLKNFAKQHCQLSIKDIEHCVDEIEDAKHKTLPLLKSLSEKHKGFAAIAEVIEGLILETSFE